MKPKIKFFTLWILPIFLALLFEVFFAEFRFDRWKNVLENLFFAAVMLLTVPLFDSLKIKTFLVNFYYLLFIFCLFLETAFFYLFGTIFSASAIYILIETNAAEAREFLGFYLDIPIFLLFATLFILLFLYLKLPKENLFQKRAKSIKIFSGISFIGILVVLKFTGLILPNFVYLTGKGVYSYVNEQRKMAHIHLDEPFGSFENVIDETKLEKSLYVLIIGESTTRNHMGIYDYYRNTTPRLQQIKEELLLYQNVISPHTYTIESLNPALTLNNFTKKSESSIVQLMNQAGFKTYWLSNQQPIGPYDSMVTEIAQASEWVKFTNSTHYSLATPYDGVLLSFFDKVLEDPANKKFVVLHLLATHTNYQHRFPESFKVFTKTPKGKFRDELATNTINDYDNAVRYVDHIIRKVIEKTKEQQLSSYVLYFSDHGDEVYDSIHFAGHTLSKATKNMFEIPFILWRSDKFKNRSSVDTTNLHKPYVTDDLIYSLADLSQINFDGMNKEKSIFSKKFKPKKRIVGEGIDYDLFFKPETERK